MKKLSTETKLTIQECILDNLWFKILSASSIVLIIISFFMPPQGVIDSSVLAASGEIMGWGALWSVLIAMKKGKGISVQHGDTTITVNGKTYKLEEKDINEINDDLTR